MKAPWLLRLIEGLLGGALGAFAGQLAVFLAHVLTGDADIWLKGPHGPPFFDLTLQLCGFYAVLGLAFARPRLKGALQGAGAAFCVFALPMTAATYVFSWGEAPGETQTLAWLNLVVVLYGFSNLVATGVIGYVSSDAPRGLRPVLGILAGALCAALIQYVISPHWGSRFEVAGWFPPVSVLYSGLLWGLCCGIGLGFCSGLQPALNEQPHP